MSAAAASAAGATNPADVAAEHVVAEVIEGMRRSESLDLLGPTVLEELRRRWTDHYQAMGGASVQLAGEGGGGDALVVAGCASGANIVPCHLLPPEVQHALPVTAVAEQRAPRTAAPVATTVMLGPAAGAAASASQPHVASAGALASAAAAGGCGMRGTDSYSNPYEPAAPSPAAALAAGQPAPTLPEQRKPPRKRKK